MQIRRYLLLSILFSIIFISGKTQSLEVVINPILPFQKTAVNLLIINSSSEGYFNLSSTIQSLNGSVQMEEAGLVYLRKGANYITKKDIEQYRVNFKSNEFYNLFNISQSLPPMNYRQCVQLISRTEMPNEYKGCQEHLANDFLVVQPIYPYSDTKVSEIRPNFSWLLPGYEQYPFLFKLKLVEVVDNPTKSLRRNLPIFEVNTNEYNLNYPLGAVNLENGKEYAWEVDVLLDNEPVTVSQPISFVANSIEKPSDIPKDISFILINEIESNVELFAVGDFRFKFYEVFSDNKLVGKLIDTETGGIMSIDYQAITTVGENKFIIELDKMVYLKHNHEYSLILRSVLEKKDYFLSIRYINPDYLK